MNDVCYYRVDIFSSSYYSSKGKTGLCLSVCLHFELSNMEKIFFILSIYFFTFYKMMKIDLYCYIFAVLFVIVEW